MLFMRICSENMFEDKDSNNISPPCLKVLSDNNSQNNSSTCTYLGESILKTLDCGFFEGNELDKFAYKRFIEKFKGAFDLQRNINDSVKLHCLKNKLKGYAYSLIQNLSINNENYGKK